MGLYVTKCQRCGQDFQWHSSSIVQVCHNCISRDGVAPITVDGGVAPLTVGSNWHENPMELPSMLPVNILSDCPLKVKIKKLHPDAVIPKYAKPGDAGLDLVAVDDGFNKVVHFEKGFVQYTEYKTGLAIEIPQGYVGLIFPRSSISNVSLSLSNSVGVIDSGYRGEIGFRFRVLNVCPIKYKKGDKIGQLIIMPYPSVELEEVEELSSTERGEGGFGSSGA